MDSTKLQASPKDIFLHLLSVVALYVSAVALGTLLFQFVNLLVPDPLSGTWAFDSARSMIRFSIASIVISFPVYLLSMVALSKSYETSPEKRNFRIRKWLIYFTLFVASLVIMGDLIALVNTFLGGDLTLRFSLKILSIFLVAGSVFYYYVADVKNHETE